MIPRILVVEDEENLLQGIKLNLGNGRLRGGNRNQWFCCDKEVSANSALIW